MYTSIGILEMRRHYEWLFFIFPPEGFPSSFGGGFLTYGMYEGLGVSGVTPNIPFNVVLHIPLQNPQKKNADYSLHAYRYDTRQK